MKTKIALSYKHAVVLSEYSNCALNEDLAATLAADMMQLGFIPSKELVDAFSRTPQRILSIVHDDLISVLRSKVGGDVNYVPMYPNFPEQVMNADYADLFLNAILHYWSGGDWLPNLEALPREFAFENIKFKEIGVIDDDEFDCIFNTLISTNESLSEQDKQTIRWFADRGNISFKGNIPFKENLCFVAGLLLKKGKDISTLVKTSTDVLRIAVALNDGDISLAEDTKFKSLPRATRRLLVQALDNVISEEDINRHRGKWVKLFHNLHVGELGSKQVVDVAKKIRNNKKITTFNGRVESALARKDVLTAIDLLLTRPGEFARRVDHLLRIGEDQLSVVTNFLKVANEVNTRVLLQLLGNLKTRESARDKTIVFPKGNVGKAKIIRKNIPALSVEVLTRLTSGIRHVLINRFSIEGSLGKVWVDPDLDLCPIPTQMRSASESAFQVGRGTRLPIGDDETLRFFVYWVGRDIDLSGSLHNESFEKISQLSYTNLRDDFGCHSGDIVNAPNGASEFIDINIVKAIDSGARYVVMNVYVYEGPSFAEHKKVYAGWMTRSNPNSNEIYDPKTVKQKVDLTSNSKVCIPVVFDLVERKAIWTDLNKVAKFGQGGNNIHSNAASIEETLEAIVDKNNKVSLYELFILHTVARGEHVKNREDADIVFSVSDGNVTPYDISVINSEYIK